MRVASAFPAGDRACNSASFRCPPIPGDRRVDHGVLPAHPAAPGGQRAAGLRYRLGQRTPLSRLWWHDPAPPVLLSAVAARTTRIRLGTSVALLPLQHPLATAEAYAMLDQISGGRLEFGFGRGFMRYDYQTLGVPWAEGRIAPSRASRSSARRGGSDPSVIAAASTSSTASPSGRRPSRRHTLLSGWPRRARPKALAGPDGRASSS